MDPQAMLVTQVVLHAEIHIIRGLATVRSGNQPAETTSTRTFVTFARRLVACAAAARHAGTLTRRDPSTARNGKNFALMTDIVVFRIIVARPVDDAINRN